MDSLPAGLFADYQAIRTNPDGLDPLTRAEPGNGRCGSPRPLPGQFEMEFVAAVGGGARGDRAAEEFGSLA